MENHEKTHLVVEEIMRREKEVELPLDIRRDLEKAMRQHELKTRRLCIYRVPQYMQENDIRSYVPQTVSLGPYHNERLYLQSMESHKRRAVKMVVERTKKPIEVYIDAMKEFEEEARACYQDNFEMGSNEFIKMLVYDGCFVLEIFRGTMEGFPEIGYAIDDPVFTIRDTTTWLYQKDMLMLENQLPLFVLNRLLELQFGYQSRTNAVATLAFHFFEPLLRTFKEMTRPLQQRVTKELETPRDLPDAGLHCLGVFHRCLFPPTTFPPMPSSGIFWNRRKEDTRQHYQKVPRVTELRYAGIKFNRKKTDRFWDIEYNNNDGCLEIPKLLIHDGTKSVFSNLIAFERCHGVSEKKLTFYLIFMEDLIKSHEDVCYLRDCDIIEHHLENHYDVANMLKGLCQEVVFDPQDSYLSELSHNVNKYYNENKHWAIFRHKYLDTLRQRYFNNPWAYLSFLAAGLLLIFTLIQTVFTVSAYYHPSS